MVIASPNIVSNKSDMSWSNGNCEILITEHPTIKVALIVVYRPGGPNYELDKFAEVLGTARKYLNSIKDDDRFENVILAGDFNFRKEHVTWDHSANGLVPHYEQGACKHKRGVSLLLDLAEEFDLEQLVGKNTRKNQLLDLVFSSRAAWITVSN